VYSEVRCVAGFGGDLVATRRFSHGRLHVTLADVSGHDLDAARMAHQFHDVLESMDGRRWSHRGWLSALNRQLCARFHADHFGAVLSVAVQPATGGYLASVANAAMPRPWIYRAACGVVERFGRRRDAAPPLGVFDVDAWLPRPRRAWLAEGDLLVLMTDGAVEALAGPGGSDETVSSLIGIRAGLGGRRLRDALASGIQRGWATSDRKDDSSVVVIEASCASRIVSATAA